MTMFSRQLARLCALVLACLVAVSAGATAQTGAGAPDPARLPSRPGVPGTAGPAGAAAAEASVPPPATGVIGGRVLSADTGLPIRRVRVSLRSGTEPQGRATLTDAEGRFVFAALRKGSYDLRANKTRYVDAAYGARRPGSTGRPLDLVEGQRIEDVTLSLATAGVITGRVVDDAGDPVVGAQVMPLRRQPLYGGRRLMPMGGTRNTDDTGTYRLFGLPPGRYYVSASTEDRGNTGEIMDTGVTGLAPTFYPSTPLSSEAQPVQVAAGAEALADITLVATAMTKVTGTLVDAAGRMALSGMLMTEPAEGENFLGAGRGMSSVGRDGTFTVSGIAPGDYVLTIRAVFDQDELMRMFSSHHDEDQGFVLPLSIGAGGISDLRVVIPPPLEVPGRMVFENGRPEDMRMFNVMAQVARARFGGTRADVGADGRFTLKMRPGTWRLATFPPEGWMVKRIAFRGRDVDAGEDIEITAEPGARVEVTVTNQLTRVDGTVLDASHKPAAEAWVIAFPRDEAFAERGGQDRFRTIKTGEGGRFEATALAPGAYLLIALADFDPRDGFDVETLEAYRTVATEVHVAHGEPQTVSLPLATLP